MDEEPSEEDLQEAARRSWADADQYGWRNEEEEEIVEDAWNTYAASGSDGSQASGCYWVPSTSVHARDQRSLLQGLQRVTKVGTDDVDVFLDECKRIHHTTRSVVDALTCRLTIRVCDTRATYDVVYVKNESCFYAFHAHSLQVFELMCFGDFAQVDVNAFNEPS
jgi:hypothetical protein